MNRLFLWLPFLSTPKAPLKTSLNERSFSEKTLSLTKIPFKIKVTHFNRRNLYLNSISTLCSTFSQFYYFCKQIGIFHINCWQTMATCNLFQPVTGSNLLQILEKWLQSTPFFLVTNWWLLDVTIWSPGLCDWSLNEPCPHQTTEIFTEINNVWNSNLVYCHFRYWCL